MVGFGRRRGFRFSFVESEVDIIDLNCHVNEIFKCIDVTDKGKSTLYFWFKAVGEQCDTGFVFDTKDICESEKFRGKLRGGTGLSKGN